MACAADSDLDPTFGNGGRVITDVSGNSDYGSAVIVQPDGKTIVAGQSGVYPVFHSVLMRHNVDGTFDQTFGNGGKVVVSLDPGGDGLSALALQPDGKIVAAGSLIQNNSTRGFVLARFNADGSLDQSIGNAGKVATTFGNDFSASSGGIVLQPDGKIIQVGTSGSGYGLALNDFALARFNADGSLDQSFGGSGKFKTHFDGVYNTGSSARDAVLQPDGKLVVAGSYVNEGTRSEFALARYNADGSLDATFDGDGKLTTALGSADASAFAVVLQADGKIAVAGYFRTASRNSDFALARYNANGSLDAAFGNGGWTINDLFGASDDIAYAMTLQSDGKLLVAGRTGQYPNFKLGLARYHCNGSFDPGFGSAGRVMSDFAGTAYSIALQPDGKIAVAGYAANATTDFAVVRYVGALELTAAAPRKVHGSMGSFGINLPLTGTPGVECRNTAGNHTLVFTFNNNVVSGGANVLGGNATIAGPPTYTANTMTVNLTSVADAQTIMLTLSNVTDTSLRVMPNRTVQVSMLVGDTNGDAFVNSGDALQTRSRSGQIADSSNFHSDVNVDGFVNSGDTTIVRSRSGTALP